jgi:hypothetical protein
LVSLHVVTIENYTLEIARPGLILPMIVYMLSCFIGNFGPHDFDSLL